MVQDVLNKDEIGNAFRWCLCAGQESEGCITSYFLYTWPGKWGVMLTLVLVSRPGLVCCSWGSWTTVCSVPLWLECREAVWEGGEGELRCWGWGACRWLGPGQGVPQNLGFPFLSRMAALGVSFGLVACVLGLVLGLCFARELLVSGEAPDWAAGRPGPPGVGAVVVRAPAP